MNKLKVPQLRFPGFDGEWTDTNLGDAFSIFNGYAFSSNSSVDEGVLWVKIADIGIQEMKSNNLSYLPASFQEKHKKFILKKGDFVVALTRPILNGKLKIAQINNFFDGALLNQRVGKIITNNSHYFIFSLLQKTNLIKSIENNIAGSDPPNLSPNEINSIGLFIPTLPEQQKIASFLSAVDEKIQQLSRKKELLEHYKKGVMQQLFSGKLRFKDESGNEYPDWEEKRLGDFKNLVHGDGDWILSENIDAGEKYSIIQLGNIGFGKFINKPMKTLSEKNFKVIKGTLIENGDLLINRMVDVNLNACVFKFTGLYVTSVDVCWIRAGSNINNVFFSNLILTEKYQKKLLSLSSGSGRVRISKKNFFDKFYFELPCLEEQQKIANFLSSIDAKIENTKGELEKIQLFKKGLLQQLFV